MSGTIPIADGQASPGDTLYFVTASGRSVKPFRLLREDVYLATPFSDPVAVIVADLPAGSADRGLYDPSHCFKDRLAAESFAEGILRRELENAERTVRELYPVLLTGGPPCQR